MQYNSFHSYAQEIADERIQWAIVLAMIASNHIPDYMLHNKK